MAQMPDLDGVDHTYVDLGDGVTIHVDEAGPPVMLVYGFPENWWEWRDVALYPVRWLSGTADAVLTPDLIDGYGEHGVGHWIVEQRPDLVLDRLRAFLAA